MDKLHHVGLLFLNFAVLNILLSLIFFLISIIGRRILSSPLLRSRLFYISLVAPPVLSTFTLFTSFAPPVFIKIAGEPMFCLNEPYCYIFSFVSPEIPFFNGLLIAAAGIILIPILYAIVSLMSYFKARAVINRLNINPRFSPFIKGELNGITGQIGGLKVNIIDTPNMVSFVWGYITNSLVISTGVLNALSTEELQCLLAHESSHYRRRDNILKGILLFCRNILCVLPHAHYLFRWWREEIELIGDEAAALITGRPLDVASALLKMQQASVAGINRDIEPYAIGFSMARHHGLLTDRIERLAAISDCKVMPGKKGWAVIPSEIGLLISLTFLFPLLFTVVYKFDPWLFHCYLEKISSLL
ncbi:MAG: M56 family metallopeptidase [Nitrospirae bacterium]|nr:M56 family metallopeptidase [Nitrospirota bacterium]